MDLQKIKDIAQELEQEQALSLIEAASASQSEDTLKIAVTGNFNAGKTTLINAIAGKELREVSGISVDDELPLRLSFEKMPEQEGFECFDVYDPVWNEEEVIFYDLKFEDIFQAGTFKPVMYDMDMVFYLVSALQVFTAEDMYALEQLKRYKIKIILTKLDAVDEESKDSVIKFVDDMCNKLGLDSALVIEKGNNEEIGKHLRGLLPSFGEIEQMRQQRADGFAREAVSLLKKGVERKLDAEEQLPAEEAAPEEDYLSKSLRLRNRILESGIQKSSNFALPDSKQRELERLIYHPGRKKQFNSDWENGMIQSTVERFLGECFEEVQSDLIDSMKRDYRSSAGSVGLEYSSEVNREIEEIAGKRPVYVDVTTAPEMQQSNGKTTKKVAIAAAVVTGAMIVPIPAWAGIAIALGTTATAVGSISNDIEKEKAKIKQAIAAYCDLVLSHFTFSMKEYMNSSYNQLANIVGKQYEESQKQAVNKENEEKVNAQKEHLTSLLEELDQM
ncbi:MAG: hypothetical protein IKE65_02325 [Clostridia bacterium]|nr:hypothetical protein [Clostridia bacterium]